MTEFFTIYLSVNIFIYVGLLLKGSHDLIDYGIKYALIYPDIWETLDEECINTAGKIIVCILFTILALPAFIAYIGTLGVLFLIIGLAKLFCYVFRKRK